MAQLRTPEVSRLGEVMCTLSEKARKTISLRQSLFITIVVYSLTVLTPEGSHPQGLTLPREAGFLTCVFCYRSRVWLGEIPNHSSWVSCRLDFSGKPFLTYSRHINFFCATGVPCPLPITAFVTWQYFIVVSHTREGQVLSCSPLWPQWLEIYLAQRYSIII